jgi:hypothetical protein
MSGADLDGIRGLLVRLDALIETFPILAFECKEHACSACGSREVTAVGVLAHLDTNTWTSQCAKCGRVDSWTEPEKKRDAGSTSG